MDGGHPTRTAAPARHRAPRLAGVDVARGLALLGMIAVHVFDQFTRRGEPTVATMVAGGRAATTFVLLAGVGLALLSGGRHPVEGSARGAIAVRALLVGAIGLVLGGMVGKATEVEVILPYYGLLFLLAIPLLYARPRTLALVSAALVVASPVAILWAVADGGGADLSSGGNLTFGTLAEDPGGFLAALFVTGSYPVLAYFAFLCAGMAIGRLDLSSAKVAGALLGGGLALAVGARLLSYLLLVRAGGLDRLLDLDDGGSVRRATNRLLWGSDDPVGSWWYLAVPAPHSNTQIDLMHTLGSAIAVLGAALLVCRVPALARLLGPLAAAGSMTLTLYVGHLLVLATGLIDNEPALFALLAVGALTFGHLWRRRLGQGPLERMVSAASRAVSGRRRF